LHTAVAVCYTKIDASSKIFNTVANTGSIEVPFTDVHRQKESKKVRKKERKKERKKGRRKNESKKRKKERKKEGRK
jgi:transposase